MPKVIPLLTTVLDKRKLDTALDKKERRVLFKTGAYGRTTMRRGMRRKKGPGPVGGYPHAHHGGIKEKIAFAVDTEEGSVSIGPIKFNDQPDYLPAGIVTVPQLINEGGVVKRRVGKLLKRGGRRLVRLIYRARPFVSLSLAPAVKKFRELYKIIPLRS